VSEASIKTKVTPPVKPAADLPRKT